VVNIVVGVHTGAVFFSGSLCNVYAFDVSCVLSSNGNDMETKAERASILASFSISKQNEPAYMYASTSKVYISKNIQAF
jgi:hypothetical protein